MVSAATVIFSLCSLGISSKTRSIPRPSCMGSPTYCHAEAITCLKPASVYCGRTSSSMRLRNALTQRHVDAAAMGQKGVALGQGLQGQPIESSNFLGCSPARREGIQVLAARMRQEARLKHFLMSRAACHPRGTPVYPPVRDWITSHALSAKEWLLTLVFGDPWEPPLLIQAEYRSAEPLFGRRERGKLSNIGLEEAFGGRHAVNEQGRISRQCHGMEFLGRNARALGHRQKQTSRRREIQFIVPQAEAE
ncbi:hypothetical protein SAMN05518861_15113 [Mesorhizobium sp. YR577]|nr:hypothetical protein SAMN05518861_15113 [Mesorhizobium sp. YR577]